MTVHSVEVPGAGESVPPVHRCLRREPLAAPGPAALEDGATCARRHPRTKSVLALPAAHVGLIGPLHGLREEKERNERGFSRAPSEYRRRLRAPVFHKSRGPKSCCETRLSALAGASLSTPVERAVGLKEIPAKLLFITHPVRSLSPQGDTGMLAVRFPLGRSRQPATWSAVNY
jgi:hypothetical protein